MAASLRLSECRDSMSFSRGKRRGNFGSVLREVDARRRTRVQLQQEWTSIFSKNEQVKEFEACSNPQRRKTRR
jgi:hypothetical protein